MPTGSCSIKKLPATSVTTELLKIYVLPPASVAVTVAPSKASVTESTTFTTLPEIPPGSSAKKTTSTGVFALAVTSILSE